MARSFGLGRGLDALIPRSAEVNGVQEIQIDRVRRNPNQPRVQFDDEQLSELAASISAHGVLQPIVVRETPGDGYELIAGERRLRAPSPWSRPRAPTGCECGRGRRGRAAGSLTYQ